MNQRARDVDDAAFGVIYGTITVMGVLAATDPAKIDPLNTGLTLLITVLVVALAKTYADLAAKSLTTGTGHSIAAVRSAWAHSHRPALQLDGMSPGGLCLSGDCRSTQLHSA